MWYHYTILDGIRKYLTIIGPRVCPATINHITGISSYTVMAIA